MKKGREQFSGKAGAKELPLKLQQFFHEHFIVDSINTEFSGGTKMPPLTQEQCQRQVIILGYICKATNFIYQVEL